MFQIENTIVSESIISEDFVCNIAKCKGECCVAGSAGAPLEKEETKILDDLNEKILPFLSDKGRKSLIKQGNYVKGDDGEWETPLIEGKECAYTVLMLEVKLNVELRKLIVLELSNGINQSRVTYIQLEFKIILNLQQ